MSLLVVTPSRGRPGRMREMAAAVHATAEGAVDIVCLVDDDDPTAPEYDIPGATVVRGPRLGLAGSSNVGALQYRSSQTHVASLGDDHRPLTPGWDLKLATDGIAYGDDELAGQNLPTAVVMPYAIIEALGYMCPPELHHLYIDNFWRDLGIAAGCLTYRSDVVIRHDHPNAGRIVWDQTYADGNATAAVDLDAYTAYLTDRFQTDVAKVRALRG